MTRVRLWSLHPKYLDPAGLVALWREGLLAQKVLAGLTRGYTRHPQLTRFREERDPRVCVSTYLAHVAAEAEHRGYSFDRSRLTSGRTSRRLQVSEGQLRFEWEHLSAKLRKRNRVFYDSIAGVELPQPHPLFIVVGGDVAEWERQ
jgi:hypothetical protein